MSNRIDQLFAGKKTGILNIYCTAGFPELNDTLPVMTALQQHGADLIEARDLPGDQRRILALWPFIRVI